MVARTELYITLAEALAEPPAWIADAGAQWPLFEAALQVAREEDSEAARTAVMALATISPEAMEARRQRYRRLFAGSGRPRLWLHESLYVDGRLLGPTTFAVQQIYRAAGLAAEGAELPDHVALELAFLGWLAEQEAIQPDQAAGWRRLAGRFIQRHAGRWLPDLGRALATSGDPVYAPIGQLLADWLAEVQRWPRGRIAGASRLPVIPEAEACTLCGFCAQVCPTQALVIHETPTETGLVLVSAACVGCGQCQRICDFDALRLVPASTCDAGVVALRTSPRALCPGCGQPTVSRAELSAVAAGMRGWPRWLNYCLACRPLLMERQYECSPVTAH